MKKLKVYSKTPTVAELVEALESSFAEVMQNERWPSCQLLSARLLPMWWICISKFGFRMYLQLCKDLQELYYLRFKKML